VDWLGAYFFRKPAVEIYWIPIAITAGLCDVEVEALTYVVLAHELAHAYTHVGQDIDGHSWDTTDFAVADPYIVEGLAQYYTQILCGRVEQRYPAALEAFLALLARQSGPYSDFGTWNLEVRDPGEHMRRSMLSARRLGMRDYGVFQALIHGGLDR
jgi:hypothetical protein